MSVVVCVININNKYHYLLTTDLTIYALNLFFLCSAIGLEVTDSFDCMLFYFYCNVYIWNLIKLLLQ